jgi:hypothetical protein
MAVIVTKSWDAIGKGKEEVVKPSRFLFFGRINIDPEPLLPNYSVPHSDPRYDSSGPPSHTDIELTQTISEILELSKVGRQVEFPTQIVTRFLEDIALGYETEDNFLERDLERALLLVTDSLPSVGTGPVLVATQSCAIRANGPRTAGARHAFGRFSARFGWREEQGTAGQQGSGKEPKGPSGEYETNSR